MFAKFLRDVILQIGRHEQLEALIVDGLQETSGEMMRNEKTGSLRDEIKP